MATADVEVSNQGNIFLFKPLTQPAQDWIEANIPDDAQYFGKSLVVEHRFAQDVAQGMQSDGLTVI